MSVAYYVVLENGYQPEMCGKALASKSKRLNALSQELGLKTLDDFLGGSPEEFADLFGNGAELPEFAAQWFSPEAGQALVESYRKHLGPNLTKDLLDDLERWEEAMELAHASGTRWRLRLDF